MSRKVYCYYECPVAEQISQNPMANCEIVIQRAACREFSKKMGWDIVREVEGSGVTSPEVSQHTNEGLPQLGALPGLKDSSMHGVSWLWKRKKSAMPERSHVNHSLLGFGSPDRQKRQKYPSDSKILCFS